MDVNDKLLKSMVATAKRALADNDIGGAKNAVSRLLERFPGEAASHGLELELLLASGETVEAERMAARLVERFSSSPGVLFQAGMAAFLLKRYGRARHLFEESNKIYPSNKTVRWLAKTLINTGHFDEAEGLLLGIVGDDPQCRSDLAWLYERKGDIERARKEALLFLERFPGNKRIEAQLLRFDADALEEAEVIEQVELLDALGETIPDALVCRYVRALVAVGRGEDARKFIVEARPHLNRRVLVDLAWTCHRLQLHDMAYELFVLVLEHHPNNFKLLNTLDFSAKRAGKVMELAATYETMGPKEPALYGRAKKLLKEAQD